MELRRRPGTVWARRAVVGAVLVVALVSCSPTTTSPRRGPRPVQVVGEAGGVRLTVVLDRDVVAPGGRIRADVQVENRSGAVARYSMGACGGPGISVSVGLRLAPGRRWPGMLGTFKDTVLAGAHLPSSTFLPGGPGDVPVVCPAIAFPPGSETLAPGTVITRRLWWDADVAPGAPARPGVVTVEASFAAFPRPIVVTGTITVVGRDPGTPSPAEIVDAALAVPGFARWIEVHGAPLQGPSLWWSAGAWRVGACCPAPPARAPGVVVDARTGRIRSVDGLSPP